MIGQILAHLVGDYILQTDRMATCKTRSLLWATAHGLMYTLPFIVLTRSLPALLVIAATHVVIDRWRLARYVVAAKNSVTAWAQRAEFFASPTGYPESAPPWLAFWLLIIADNTCHLAINAAALRWLA